jgi:hypothetical protein
MRFFVQSIFESLEAKWDNRRTVEKIRDTLTRVGKMMGNERL